MYLSKSALHLHVKKKHGGIYPPGTPNPPKPRRKHDHKPIMDSSFVFRDSRFGQQDSEEDKNDIYNSDS